jgi:hypothetical protein
MRRDARWLLALLLTLVAVPAAADNRRGIWPGMGADAIIAALKPLCPDVAVGGEGAITCKGGKEADATVVTATVSSKGRAYSLSWSEKSDDEVLTYAKRIAAEFGLSGPGKECTYYGYELRCWYAADGTVLYAGERDMQKRYVTYLVNNKIMEEDEGPATEATVTPEE